MGDPAARKNETTSAPGSRDERRSGRREGQALDNRKKSLLKAWEDGK
jgi:hypothetical protein